MNRSGLTAVILTAACWQLALTGLLRHATARATVREAEAAAHSTLRYLRQADPCPAVAGAPAGRLEAASPLQRRCLSGVQAQLAQPQARGTSWSAAWSARHPKSTRPHCLPAPVAPQEHRARGEFARGHEEH
jgi:hypothetical protein